MSRIEQLERLLIDDRHAALITSDISRKYLCGFTSSAGVILITKEQSYLLIDFRYYEKARQRVTDCQVILLEDMRKQLMDLLVKHGISVVSVESDSMTLTEMEKYKANYSFVTFDTGSALSDKLTKMRSIKTADELEKIIAAQRIAEKAFDKLLNNIKIGQTEKHVAAMLDYYMAECGSDGLSFDTIAASGVNSASPHAVPTDKKLEDGDFLTLDFGATYDGYHSDMTRTVAIGHATDKMREMYDAVLSANLDAHKAAKAGISGKLLDSVARSTLDAWNYGEYFKHGLGHGVGLEIHEAPTAGMYSVDTLKEGMIVTIEPGAYITGKYGVRIEDMVVITADGCRNLTKTGKGLIII
ncbi:MAG: aminopeptidase P family protein [Eubacterium sp.]|nr:aminopeptidase P family protein [Eubacterium sp.]